MSLLAVTRAPWALLVVFVALFIAGTTASDPENSDVVILTSENFDDTTQDGQWLVEFYAPWCGHCKRLAPTWEKAATDLKGKVNFGKVDCTSHKDVCSKHDVDGYPSIKFLDGSFNHSYEGPRSFLGLKQYATRMTGPTVMGVKKNSFPPSRTNPVVFTLFLKAGEKKSSVYDRYSDACLELKDRVTCTSTTDADLSSKYSVSSFPRLLVIKDGEQVAYEGNFSVESIQDWLRIHQFVLVSDFTLDNFHSIARAGKKTVIAAVDPQAPGIGALRKTLASLGRDFRNDLNFGILDGVEHYQFTQNFGIKVEHLPIVFVLDAPEQIHWVDFEVGLDEDALRSWLSEVTGGQVEGKGSNFFTKAMKIARQAFAPLVDLVADNIYASLGVAVVLLFLMFRLILSLDDEQPSPESKQSKPKED